MIWQIHSTGSAETELLAEQIGKHLIGGQSIELRADLGGGKTTFTKGLARGLGVKEQVTSPTFVVERCYSGNNKIILRHFDIFRLDDPGLLKQQIEESVNEPNTVTVIEWADNARQVLPKDRLTITLSMLPNNFDARQIVIEYTPSFQKLILEVQNTWNKENQ